MAAKSKRKPLYIETKIQSKLDSVWTYTQEPAIHQQWDLRFSEISYLPKEQPEEPQKFLYATRIGFGVRIKGTGESIATKTKGNGESTSVLKFSSDSPLSLIKEGSGYWKYIPEPNGIKFFTGYDYTTRWGIFGKIFDAVVFRPLMIWATAWSFDCLKNWIEKGMHPKKAIASQLIVWLAALMLGITWLYQGLVPKLLYTDTGELAILQQSGLFRGYEEKVLTAVGLAEIGFGLILLLIHKRFVHLLNILALLLLGLGAVFSDPTVFTLPFNPFSLNLSMIGLSFIAIIHLKDLPRASNCKTKP
jgi:hypothetical protein